MGTDSKAVQKSGSAKGQKGEEKRPVVFYITGGGHELAKRISGLYPDAELLKFNTSVFAGKWRDAKNIICIMAAGIVVRAMASLLEDKKTDPAVVVLDEKGKYAVSIAGGHLGGANALAREIAGYLGAHAVITTASDVQGKIALDLWAREKNLYVEDSGKLKKLSSRIVNDNKIKVCSDCPCDEERMPDEFIMVKSKDESDIIISHRLLESTALFLRPGNLFVGIGCNRGTSREEIEEMTRSVFEKEKLSFHSIRSFATIDLKKDEQGLIDFAGANNINIEFFSKDDLNNAALKHKIEESDAVKAATGAVAVAEPAAALSAKKISERYTIIKPKEKKGNVTLAIAKAEFLL